MNYADILCKLISVILCKPRQPKQPEPIDFAEFLSIYWALQIVIIQYIGNQISVMSTSCVDYFLYTLLLVFFSFRPVFTAFQRPAEHSADNTANEQFQ